MFAEAVRSWQVLPSDKKSEYNRKAKRVNISRYNLYISGQIKDKNSAVSEEHFIIYNKTLPCNITVPSGLYCSICRPLSINNVSNRPIASIYFTDFPF